MVREGSPTTSGLGWRRGNPGKLGGVKSWVMSLFWFFFFFSISLFHLPTSCPVQFLLAHTCAHARKHSHTPYSPLLRRLHWTGNGHKRRARHRAQQQRSANAPRRAVADMRSLGNGRAFFFLFHVLTLHLVEFYGVLVVFFFVLWSSCDKGEVLVLCH